MIKKIIAINLHYLLNTAGNMAVRSLCNYASSNSIRRYRSISSCFYSTEVQNIAAIRKDQIYPPAISTTSQRLYHKTTAPYQPDEKLKTSVCCATKTVPVFSTSTRTYQRTSVDFAETLPKRQFSELDFCRADEAFENRATRELFRALIVLKLSSYRLLVDNSLKVRKPWNLWLRSTPPPRGYAPSQIGGVAWTSTVLFVIWSLSQHQTTYNIARAETKNENVIKNNYKNKCLVHGFSSLPAN